MNVYNGKKYSLDLFLIFLPLFVFFLSCDSDSVENPNFNDYDNHVLEKISYFDTITFQGINDLPKCDESRSGRAFFVTNNHLPYFCMGGEWKSANDSLNFSITCKNGYLQPIQKINLDKIENSRVISGLMQKGPFVFGSNITIQEVDSNNFYRVNNQSYVSESCDLKNEGKYSVENVKLNSDVVKIEVNGFYRNEVDGSYSDKPISLSALANISGRDSVNINVLTHIEIPRIEQLVMNHIPFEMAKAQAEREIFAAFGMDTTKLYSENYFQDGRVDKPFAEDLSILGNSEFNAALLAISIMLQADLNESDMMNLINNIAEDIKGDGVWNDLNFKIKIADWIVGIDSSWKYNDIRNNISRWKMGSVPNFENYIRSFYPYAYGFEPCTELNAGKITFVNNGQSKYFANDFKHIDKSTVRFTCDVNSKLWRVSTALEKDTAGFGEGLYDKEIREGNINYGTYYLYELEKKSWRVASTQEADGFTDIGEVYANLKSNEKVIFIIRHAERTDDTSEKGHLTKNGLQQAISVGEKLKGIEDFYFGYSGFTRTKETCENIAKGRGQTSYNLEILPYMDGGWYVKNSKKVDDYMNSDGGGWVVYSKYGFIGAYSDAFYDLETRSEQLLKDEILPNLPKMKRVNVMCTHDFLVVPLLAYTTDGHANVRYYEKWKWVNYLSGVAVVISSDGSMKYIPVKGLESGTM